MAADSPWMLLKGDIKNWCASFDHVDLLWIDQTPLLSSQLYSLTVKRHHVRQILLTAQSSRSVFFSLDAVAECKPQTASRSVQSAGDSARHHRTSRNNSSTAECVIVLQDALQYAYTVLETIARILNKPSCLQTNMWSELQSASKKPPGSSATHRSTESGSPADQLRNVDGLLSNHSVVLFTVASILYSDIQ